MTKSSWKIFGILTAIVSVVLIPAGWKYVLGYLLGCFVSVLVYRNTVHYVDETIRRRVPAGGLHRTLNYMMWAGSMILCAFEDHYLNILTCALGLFMIRITLLISHALGKDG